MGPAIFFDLDGTLTDPKPGITHSIQYALEKLGHSVPSEDELIWCIGPPLLESFRQLVGDERAQSGVDYYRERFADVGLFENEPYVGIGGVLQELQQRGTELFVASSKPLVFVSKILDHFDLASHFSQVFGSELDGTRTDKSELLAYALEATDIAAEMAIMIGDRSHDAIGALNNNMLFLGALYGYGSVDEFRQAGVNKWVDSPDELIGALVSYGVAGA